MEVNSSSSCLISRIRLFQYCSTLLKCERLEMIRRLNFDLTRGKIRIFSVCKTLTILGIEESHTPLSTTFTSKSLWRYCHVVYQQSLYMERYSGSSTLCQEFRTGDSTQESDRSQLFNGLEFPIVNFNSSDFLATSIFLSYCKIPFLSKELAVQARHS